jgi:ribosomal protein S27E
MSKKLDRSVEREMIAGLSAFADKLEANPGLAGRLKSLQCPVCECRGVSYSDVTDLCRCLNCGHKWDIWA